MEQINMKSFIRSFILVLFIIAFPAESKGMKKKVKMFSFMLKNGVLQSLLAKEICSCVFVSKLDVDSQLGEYANRYTDEQKVPFRVKECLKRANIPIPDKVLKLVVENNVQKGTEDNEIEMSFSRTRVWGSLIAWRVSSQNKTATAVYYGPRRGCRLISN